MLCSLWHSNTRERAKCTYHCNQVKDITVLPSASHAHLLFSLQKPHLRGFASSSAQNTVSPALQSYFLIGLPWPLHLKWPALPQHPLTQRASPSSFPPWPYRAMRVFYCFACLLPVYFIGWPASWSGEHTSPSHHGIPWLST